MTASYPHQKKKTDEPCMICLDEGGDDSSRRYCKCCGKPVCVACAWRCMASYRAGKGCPSCRSTLDVLHVTANIHALNHVSLRMNGRQQELAVRGSHLNKFTAGYRSILKAASENPARNTRAKQRVMSELEVIAIEAISASIRSKNLSFASCRFNIKTL